MASKPRQSDRCEDSPSAYPPCSATGALEERIPAKHLLRQLRVVVNAILVTMDTELAALYARTGRNSIAPERLLRPSLIQILLSLRSERQLVSHIHCGLL